ncbi:hypothetical protein HHL23_05075 [Chryseobacterium sp. RP-3-3]|uniref:Uncharacterized protein n=1 Tax=Chryseobacterium antibioticum TaxID=2728847 RepID=A0A7Y0FQL0_9FLAO|nr:hypothetical protein [Chryseobacterium antibioticum]NML69163.1 hypothetical protein [Chryseobacterium antibioticum]
MKKLLFLGLIISSMCYNAQRYYNVDILGEGHFHYDTKTPFKDFIQSFSKNEFIKSSKINILDSTKIGPDKLKNYHKMILDNIPKNNINHIWVIFGYSNGNYYSKYFLGENLIKNENNFFVQLNYFVNKKNNLIDSIGICIPKNGCREIKKYKPIHPTKIFQSIEMQKNNFPVDNSYSLKKYEEDRKKLEEDKKTIWTMDKE